MGSINDLNKHHGQIPVSCSRAYYIEPIGYVMVWLQFNGIPSYDEDQVALVIRNQSEFSQGVLVVIGTPTIDWVVWVLKESELYTIPEEWQRAWHAHEYVHGFFARTEAMDVDLQEVEPTAKAQDQPMETEQPE